MSVEFTVESVHIRNLDVISIDDMNLVNPLALLQLGTTFPLVEHSGTFVHEDVCVTNYTND